MKLSNRQYDTAKWVALVALPAFATFYAAMGSIWAWPHTTPTVASITALDAFLGTLLGLSSAIHENAVTIEDALVDDPDALAEAEAVVAAQPRRAWPGPAHLPTADGPADPIPVEDVTDELDDSPKG